MNYPIRPMHMITKLRAEYFGTDGSKWISNLVALYTVWEIATEIHSNRHNVHLQKKYYVEKKIAGWCFICSYETDNSVALRKDNCWNIRMWYESTTVFEMNMLLLKYISITHVISSLLSFPNQLHCKLFGFVISNIDNNSNMVITKGSVRALSVTS